MARKLLSIFHDVSRGRFLYLVIVLLLYLLISPLLENFYRVQVIYYLFLMAILMASLLAIKQSRTQIIFSLILAVPMVVLVCTAFFYNGRAIVLASNLVSALFIFYIIVAILKFVFSCQRVDQHVIFAAIAAYLLIGVFWSLTYTVLGIFDPQAFRFPSASREPLSREFTYFSFVTITTLGYGDITPVSNSARAMAFVEALIGQIYMTVLIAWLVGIFVSDRIKSDSDKAEP